MSTHYLIDYENVHEIGLFGMQELTAEDSVYIFHTSVYDRISLTSLDDIRAWVRVIPVPPGNQSLDMHLSSFLGYLIGKEETADTRYAIVSHDRDYKGITNFWNKAYQMSDKVTLVHCKGQPHKLCGEGERPVASFDCTEEHTAIRRKIIQIFNTYSITSSFDTPCMVLSELCTLLNGSKEYLKERKRLGKKPMKYLQEECRDILKIVKRGKQDWAYLLVKEAEDESEAPEAEAAQEPAGITAAEEEEDPGFMVEIGDLSIDGEPMSEEPVGAVEPEEPVAPDFLAAARECMRQADEGLRNIWGHVRAAAVRDALMAIPEFRAAQKDSGMKPIPFLQQLFAGELEIYREKGIWWAAEASARENRSAEAEEEHADQEREKAIGERGNFYMEAYENIRNQLDRAGLDEAVTEEIADIYMRARGETEPRKVIHTILCKRFGPRAGAEYYRKAVKYCAG